MYTTVLGHCTVGFPRAPLALPGRLGTLIWRLFRKNLADIFPGFHA